MASPGSDHIRSRSRHDETRIPDVGTVDDAVNVGGRELRGVISAHADAGITTPVWVAPIDSAGSNRKSRQHDVSMDVGAVEGFRRKLGPDDSPIRSGI